LGFYLPFYVPKWVVLKKLLAATSLYIEWKIIRPAHVLFDITEAQGRRVIRECMFPSQNSSTAFMSIASPNFYAVLK